MAGERSKYNEAGRPARRWSVTQLILAAQRSGDHPASTTVPPGGPEHTPASHGPASCARDPK